MSSPENTAAKKSAWPWRIGVITILGLALVYSGGIPVLVVTGWAAGKKIGGAAPECAWGRIASIYWDNERFISRYEEYDQEAKVVDRDEEWEIVQVEFRGNRFWVKEEGHDRDGRSLIAYLHAEHESIVEEMGRSNIEQGDVVLDLGSHVGVFSRRALSEGASKVVAVDPDPTQVECLNRNFAAEIEQGRVVVVPKAIWKEEGTITLHVGHLNSAMSSIVKEQKGGDLEAPTVSIDQLVADLGLERVDFVKMDIEGAEREGLEGAEETLTKFQPRLLVDSYHLEDDGEVLYRMIAESKGGYEPRVGWCEMRPDKELTLVPHFLYTF